MKKATLLLVLLWFPLTLLGFKPSALWLSWQNDPCTTMTVQWMTKQKGGPTTLEYRVAGDEGSWLQAEARARYLPYTKDHYILRTELIGLEANTRYEARIGSDSEPFRFRTMPATDDEPIVFIDGGDMYHDDAASMNSTSMTAAAQNPRFVVIGGDIAYSSRSGIKGESQEKWISWLKNWSQTMVTSEGDVIPILPAIGNHEVNKGYGKTPRDAQLFYATFPLPSYKAYRVIDFGNYLSLFLLDSGHTAETGGVQRSWLTEQLKQRETRPIKVASYHVPAYPSVRDYNDKRCMAVRRSWVSVFDRYGLDVAFEHHDHSYKRTHRLKRGKPDPTGTLYLGDGCWGIKQPRRHRRSAPYLAKFGTLRHFFLITLHNKGYNIRALSSEGKVFDEVTVPATPAPQLEEQTAQTPNLHVSTHHRTICGCERVFASAHSQQE